MGYKRNEPSVILVDYIGGGKRGERTKNPRAQMRMRGGVSPGQRVQMGPWAA